MMQVGESVSVVASFIPPHRIQPVRFQWSGRLLEVSEVTYTWRSREGEREIYHFAVTDGTALYELSFDTKTLIWRLENLEA